MNNVLRARYFIASILFHIFCFVIFIWASLIQNVKKHFVVYGMTTSTYAYFKPMRMVRKMENSRDVAKRPSPTRIVEARSKFTKPSKLDIKKVKTVKVPERRNNKNVLKRAPVKNIKKLAELREQETKKVAEKQKKDARTFKQEVIKKEKDQLKKMEATQKQNLNEKEVLSFVLGGEVDLALEEYQIEVQREISRVWHPPVGVAEDVECEVLIVPAFGGSIKSFEIVKESKIKIYDSSVKLAIDRIRFEGRLRELWGKTICLTFKQW